jgi:recombination protein RecA
MNALETVIAEINKKYKGEVITVGTSRIKYDKIPFSSPRANYITYGGIPKGKATELFGPEGGGKTTAALDLVGQAQKLALRNWQSEYDSVNEELIKLVEKNNKSDKDKIKKLEERKAKLEEDGPRRAVYVDCENTLDEDWARLNGVDTDSLILIRPQDHTAEQVLQMILDIIDSGLVEILVLDSIPMLVSQQLFEETLEKKSYGGIAGAMAEFCRRVSPRLSKYNTALIMINQVRDNIENPYDIYNTPGGRALKHLYSLRIYCRKGSFLDEKNQEIPNSRAENPSGNRADLKIVKTKVCKPDRLVGYHTINYTKGIDVLNDTVDMAIHFGFIQQSGAWFRFIDISTGEIMTFGDGEELKFQGKPKLLEYLQEDQDLFQELYEAVNEKIKEE